MWGMSSEPSLTELRRGVLGPCVLALLAQRPRFGLEVVRELAAAGGLLTSDGTVYPLLNRLRDAGLVTSQWQDAEGERARRYYFITDDGREHLAAFRAEWAEFADTVRGVLLPPVLPVPPASRGVGGSEPHEGKAGEPR
jgi:PadR family transcriptional regulator PadR